MPVLASHSSCMVWMLRAADPDLRAASSEWVVQAGCEPAVVVVVGLDSTELPFDEELLYAVGHV